MYICPLCNKWLTHPTLLPVHILCLSRLICWSFWPGRGPSTKNQGQPLDNCVSANGRSAQALLRPAYYENTGTSRCFGRLQVCTRPTYNRPPRQQAKVWPGQLQILSILWRTFKTSKLGPLSSSKVHLYIVKYPTCRFEAGTLTNKY